MRCIDIPRRYVASYRLGSSGSSPPPSPCETHACPSPLTHCSFMFPTAPPPPVSITNLVSRHQAQGPCQARERCERSSWPSRTLGFPCQISPKSPKSRKAANHCRN